MVVASHEARNEAEAKSERTSVVDGLEKIEYLYKNKAPNLGALFILKPSAWLIINNLIYKIRG